jgi:AcrR family transcriptional regulator
MGKLIDPKRTRRAREARKERARKILETAESVFVRHPYADITLDTIGQMAGVKQGQANLAFRSREELYLIIIRHRMTDWYAALDAWLTASEEPLTTGEAATFVAASLTERPDFTRLLGPLHTAMELHDDGFEVHNFYRWQRERLLELADAMVRRIAGADRWSCFDALYRSQLIAAAVHPVSRPVGNLAADLMVEEHQIFALDLEDEVRRTVVDSLES